MYCCCRLPSSDWSVPCETILLPCCVTSFPACGNRVHLQENACDWSVASNAALVDSLYEWLVFGSGPDRMSSPTTGTRFQSKAVIWSLAGPYQQVPNWFLKKNCACSHKCTDFGVRAQRVCLLLTIKEVVFDEVLISDNLRPGETFPRMLPVLCCWRSSSWCLQCAIGASNDARQCSMHLGLSIW